MFQDENEPESYKSILKAQSVDWLMCEIDHRISNEASNELFEVAKKWFYKLYVAKENQGVSKNTPQFGWLRSKLYDNNIPKISMEVAYLNKSTNSITLLLS